MIVILGAGLAGLSTAYHLRRGGRRAVAVYERAERPGGLCRSETVDGFTFDHTGHFLHLRDPAIKRLASRWLGEDLPEVVRRSFVFSHGVYTRYPFQTNTYGLPVDVVKECVLGLIQARYESVQVPRDAGEGETELPEPRESFERWIYETFGPGIARHFMVPYNRKVWGVHPRFMTTDWMSRYVPPAPLERVIEGALTDQTPNVGYNATFRYPRRGGIETFVRALAERAGPVHTDREALEIDVGRRRVRFADGEAADYETLVSTLPLPELCRRLRPLPPGVGEAASRLRWAAVFAVNLGLRGEPGAAPSGRPVPAGLHWVYVPEARYRFYRVGCFSNAASAMAPPGHRSVWVEMARPAGRRLDRRAARRHALQGLQEMGLLPSPRDVVAEWLLDIPCAYVTFDARRRRAVQTIRRHLARHHIHAIGRYGRWEYSSMEDALLQGRALARHLLGHDD